MFEYLIGHLDIIWNYIVPFLVVLTILVFVHEWGHYQVARWCNVRVETFSIGFGPELFGRTDKSGTRWKFSLVPLGGYVKMLGDMDAASARGSIEKIAAEDRPYAFPLKTVGQRAAIVFAGPAVNFLFAILVLSVLYMGWGQPYTAPVIDAVAEQSAAAEAGLRNGDEILSINGSTVRRFEDVQRAVQISAAAPLHLTVQREGKTLDIAATPKIKEITDRFDVVHQIPMLGISSSKMVYEKRNLPEALYYSVIETYDLTAATLKAVGQIFTGMRSTKELGGPLRIAQLSGQAAQIDIPAIIGLIALLSINLGLINLFPIPLLDGGHLLFYGIEAVRGKPPSENVMNASAMVGLAVVGSLMLLAVYNDLTYFQFFQYVAKIFS